jgi:hypothetical protein
MFSPVKPWKRILVQVLVATQLISAASFARAMPAPQDADGMPCAEMMDMASSSGDSDNCPCCPEGVDSLAACLAACAAAVGIVSPLTVSLVRSDSPRVSLPIAIAHSRLFDPPLKPPPIA